MSKFLASQHNILQFYDSEGISRTWQRGLNKNLYLLLLFSASYKQFMTFDGEISSAYRFTANITLLGEMNNKCFSLKLPCNIGCCALWQLHNYSNNDSSQHYPIILFFSAFFHKRNKGFQNHIGGRTKKKSAAVNYSLLCIDMNSCHLNQYFNSKPNHSPLDKILQCHFLLLDLSSGWQWIMILCLLAVLLVMSLESTVNKGFQFDG